ncbi:unnamed protein product, partial [Symbiodinium sp. KB8]
DWQVFHYFATGSDCEWHWTVELLGGDDMVRWLAWAMLFLALWGCAGAPAEAADVSEVPVEPADVPEVPAEPAVDVGEVAPAGPTVEAHVPAAEVPAAEAHAPEPVADLEGELPGDGELVEMPAEMPAAAAPDEAMAGNGGVAAEKEEESSSSSDGEQDRLADILPSLMTL